MPPTDQSDEQPNSPRLPKGWRVVSNLTRKPVPPDDELKKLIQEGQGRGGPIRRKRYRRIEPPEAA
jgi:hypothetical protein